MLLKFDEIDIWIKYAKFTTLENARRIFLDIRQNFTGSKKDYINLVLDNAKFEEAFPLVARTLYERLTDKLPLIISVTIEHARFESGQGNADKAEEVIKEALQ
jgi:hypothetical protein